MAVQPHTHTPIKVRKRGERMDKGCRWKLISPTGLQFAATLRHTISQRGGRVALFIVPLRNSQ